MQICTTDLPLTMDFYLTEWLTGMPILISIWKSECILLYASPARGGQIILMLKFSRLLDKWLDTPRLFFFTAIFTSLLCIPAAALENGLARTPPMGWNSWNHFWRNIHEQMIREMADAMVTSGMKEAGYVYINIDGQTTRDSYARVRSPGGVNPFLVYAVINDGAFPGDRSSDGAFITSSQ